MTFIDESGKLMEEETSLSPPKSGLRLEVTSTGLPGPISHSLNIFVCHEFCLLQGSLEILIHKQLDLLKVAITFCI